MKRGRQYISFVIFGVQLITSVIAVHVHPEDLVLPVAHPVQFLVNHADAANCRDEPLSQEKFCLLYTMVRLSLQQSAAQSILFVEEKFSTIPNHPSQFHLVILTSSQSHRGPPQYFA